MDELREIIYRERTDLDSFLQENQLWEDLYDDFYIEAYAKYIKGHSWGGPQALEVFNEAYFYCNVILIDSHPETDFKLKFLGAGEFLTEIEEATKQIATSIAYVVLTLSQYRKLKQVKRFLITTEIVLHDDEFFKSAQNFVQNCTVDYNVSIKIAPIAPDELDFDYGPSLPDLWLRLIKSFVLTSGKYYKILSFKKILSLYETKEDKLKVLKQMKEASALDFDPDDTYPILSTLRAEIESIKTEKNNIPKEVTEWTPAGQPPKEVAPSPDVSAPIGIEVDQAQNAQKGRTKNYLFAKGQLQALAQEFLQKLTEEGFTDLNGTKNPSPRERERIYNLLLKFNRNHRSSLDVQSGASMCRFLTESCGIFLPKKKGNNRNFENEIRTILNAKVH